MLARVLETVAPAQQILISSYLQWQWPGMKCFDVCKCFYKTVEAFLDPVSFFSWALRFSSMDISQTGISGRSKVFAFCLCSSNSKLRILIFIYYEKLLVLPKTWYLMAG